MHPPASDAPWRRREFDLFSARPHLRCPFGVTRCEQIERHARGDLSLRRQYCTSQTANRRLAGSRPLVHGIRGNRFLYGIRLSLIVDDGLCTSYIFHIVRGCTEARSRPLPGGNWLDAVYSGCGLNWRIGRRFRRPFGLPASASARPLTQAAARGFFA